MCPSMFFEPKEKFKGVDDARGSTSVNLGCRIYSVIIEFSDLTFKKVHVKATFSEYFSYLF